MAQLILPSCFERPFGMDGAIDLVEDCEKWGAVGPRVLMGFSEMLGFRELLLQQEFLRFNVSADNGLFMPYGRFRDKQVNPIGSIGWAHPLMERPKGEEGALIAAMALVPEPQHGLIIVHPGFIRYQADLDVWYFSPDGNQSQRLSHWTVVHLPSIERESLLESWYIKKPRVQCSRRSSI